MLSPPPGTVTTFFIEGVDVMENPDVYKVGMTS